MAKNKKKKEETVSDIIDRIEEDLMTLRDKVEELENHECEEDEDDSEENDWDEDSDSTSTEEDED
jgi:hypothetical protein